MILTHKEKAEILFTDEQLSHGIKIALEGLGPDSEYTTVEERLLNLLRNVHLAGFEKGMLTIQNHIKRALYIVP